MRETGWLIALAMVADAAWLSIAVSLLGWTFAQKGALLPFAVVLFVLLLAYGCGRVAPASEPREASSGRGGWLFAQMTVGFVVALAVQQFAPAAAPLARFWIGALVLGEITTIQGAGILIGLFVTVLLWRRGVAHGIDGVRDRFASMFFWGCLVIVAAALVDSICACGIVESNLVVAFFACVLIGLALAQIPADDGNAGAWGRAITYAVGLILLAAYLVGQGSNWFGDAVAATIADLWRAAIGVVVDVVVAVVGPVIVWGIRFINWLMGESGAGGAGIDMPDLTSLRVTPTAQPVETWAREIIQLALVGLLVFGLYRFLIRRFGPRFLRQASLSFDQREQIGDGDNATWLDLLTELLPAWMRAKRDANSERRLPAAEQGIREAFALYYTMLDSAARRGLSLAPSATPNERVPAIEACLVGAPVNEITCCFNRACYGEEPTSLEALASLRQQLLASANDSQSEG